ncbi:DUF6210 family protein [Hahella aquimaris]|uniref:DUF6210 family protein n=1 Tax=Hahella sp. HNIBRBA332 TaxID=3015983 RepID=UPI00273BAFFF|nr:DUF6210 family protein [Hahella sp. HNIBRBA332]WLQ16555.1 DUF6210 family protein [Hahella sp. HNIBRBA332]
MKITLYDSVGTAIIIGCKSGVIYSNQTGGTACLQSEYEGVLIPIANTIGIPDLNLVSPENELENYFTGHPWFGVGATLGLSEEDARAIDAILKEYALDDQISVDRSMLRQSHEAWIHINIVEVEGRSLFNGFGPYPRKGVLTWQNSD